MGFVKRRAGALAITAALHGAALAAPGQRAQAEIKHLLDYVATPGCQFNRNGSWHEGAEARSHLQEKYDYLVKRAATGSSMSGKDYLVKCGADKPVASAVYMKEELARFRARAGK